MVGTSFCKNAIDQTRWVSSNSASQTLLHNMELSTTRPNGQDSRSLSLITRDSDVTQGEQLQIPKRCV